MKAINTKQERFRINNSKVFNSYLSEIKKYQPLTTTEEFEIALRMVDGCKEARDKLIKHNLLFVVSVAKQYYGNNIKLEDLINEGNVGLLLATEKYDPTKGFRFISYAVWWIRREIIGFLGEKGEVIRLPLHVNGKINKVKDMYILLEQKLCRVPLESDLITALGKDASDDIDLFFKFFINNFEMLDDLQYNGEEGLTKLDMLVNEDEADFLTSVNDTKLRMINYLRHLKPQQKKVMVMLYGLNGNEEKTLEVIADDMGVSKERVRQLRIQSLNILKAKVKFK